MGPVASAPTPTDHVHFSFGWAGARKQTSYWDGNRVTYGSPARVGTPSPD